jgi:glycosyltransferase involved in cell wall biosynthesis
MSLRIVTVLAGAPVGGAETFFTTLTTALARAGFAVQSVLKPNARRECVLREQGIAFVTAPFRVPFDWTTKNIIRNTAEQFCADVILAFAGRAARFVPQGRYQIVGRLGGYYNLANFRRCDHLVCNSTDVMRYVLNEGWPKSGATLIPNFAALPSSPPVRRVDLETPEGAPVALALGRLHRKKGLDLLIRAAAMVPELFVWIAGEGPEKQKLLDLAEQLNMQERVRFLGWRDDRAALYAAADVCVYPSREEPFGNVVVEAWSCGVPLVTTRTAGPSWLVRHGEDALLTPVEDAAALAQAIRQILRSPELRDRLVAHGRERIAAEFSETAVVSRYAELFRALID